MGQLTGMSAPANVEAAFERFRREARFLPFPESLRPVHEFFRELASNDFLVPHKQWLHAAEIAVLAKYIILEGTTLEIPRYDLVPPLNSYKALWRMAEEATVGPSRESERGLFLFRLLYQQLPFMIYGRRLRQFLFRTQRMFACEIEFEGAHVTLQQDLMAVTGVSLGDFLTMVEVIFHAFKKSPDVHRAALVGRVPRSMALPLERVLDFLSASRNVFSDLCRKYECLKVHQKPYEFNPLMRRPIINHQGILWAPYPEMIIHAASSYGLFFAMGEALGEKAKVRFGKAFEAFVASVARTRLPDSMVLTEEEERSAGWSGKTNDVTLLLEDAAILIECKVSMLYSVSKKTGSFEDIAADLRKNIANPEDRSGLYQLFGKIRAIREGSLPEPLKLRYKNVRRVFPIILLHDQVKYANAEVILGALLNEELLKNGVEPFPFQIWHLDEFEDLLAFARLESLVDAVTEKFLDKRFREWDLDTFLHEKSALPHLIPHLFVPEGQEGLYQKLETLSEQQKRDFRPGRVIEVTGPYGPPDS
jgi:hypothetical protein